LIFLLGFTVSIANAKTIVVADMPALKKALKTASGGEQLRLKPGNYGRISLWKRTFTPELMIISDNPEKPAKFDSVKIRRSHNITFDSVIFNAKFGSESKDANQRAFESTNSSHITIKNSAFIGDMVEPGEGKPDIRSDKTLRRNDAIVGFYIGAGAVVKHASNIYFSHNTFKHFHVAAQFVKTNQLYFGHNSIHDIRMDATNFAEINNAVIENNTIENMIPWTGPGGSVNPSIGDHADLIQFWTTSTDKPSSNVTIRNNYLSSGLNTYYVQGIFIRNEKLDQGTWNNNNKYTNFVICGNHIQNAHVHGITVSGIEHSKIMHNTVIRNNYSASDDKAYLPSLYLRQGSDHIYLKNNIVAAFKSETKGKLVKGPHAYKRVRDYSNWQKSSIDFFDYTNDNNINRLNVCNKLEANTP
ncbi:MAG: hypothetical protein KTR17_01330, partial [Cellvibrionaceae bacterium]|nr:hypothetical protein [Cellvibrionaceae bacterium]